MDGTFLGVELGTPFGEYGELFAGLEYNRITAGMDPWDMAALYGSPTTTPIYRDWDVVNELSDVSVRTWDLSLGARWRLPSGYGLELAWGLTDYSDNDPILEDESGRYNVLSAMVSKHF